MHLIKSLLASALLVAAAVAQGISFTSFPEDVQAGKSVTVTWTGGSDEVCFVLNLRLKPILLSSLYLIPKSIANLVSI